MNTIVGFIKSITIYILLSSMLMNLTDNKKYKKFIELVSGIILVILIANPLLTVLGYKGNLMSDIENYNILFNSPEPLLELANNEMSRNESIMSNYRESLTDKLYEILDDYGYYAVASYFDIEDDVEAKDYGSIRAMSVTAAKQTQLDDEENSVVSIERVDRVRIGGISEEDEVYESRAATPEEIMLKNKLSDFYNVSSDNINIIIQEESDGG